VNDARDRVVEVSENSQFHSTGRGKYPVKKVIVVPITWQPASRLMRLKQLMGLNSPIMNSDLVNVVRPMPRWQWHF